MKPLFSILIGIALIVYSVYGFKEMPDATDQPGDSTARFGAQIFLAMLAILGGWLIWLGVKK